MFLLRTFVIWILALLVQGCVPCHAATPGSFRGTVVEGANGAPEAGWLYVRGRNGSIRRVDISQAAIEYDDTVPPEQRKASARQQLVIGAEVRVTAEQRSDGEWRASRVEIIKLAPIGRAGNSASAPQIEVTSWMDGKRAATA